MRREIPFFNYPSLFATQETEIMSTVRRVLASGKLILQEDLEQFERNLAEFVGVRHAIGVGNGTDAILLALRASGVEPGDEVILPSHTFVATASATHYASATPVLVDVGDDHMIDPDAVRAAITTRTKAVVPVQLNGRTCDMDALQAIVEEYGLLLVEDAAQGLGAAFRGRKAGSFGRAAGFSFYPAKLLGCYGDGGAVTTDDDAVAARVRVLRNHGRTETGDVGEWSYNSRLDNLQAALLDLKLRTFANDIERRREIGQLYHERLSVHEELLLPPAPDDDPSRYDVYQNYEIEAPNRDALRAHLQAHGVHTIIQWGGKAVHLLPALGFQTSLPTTERVMARSFLLPMNTSLSDAEIDYICDTIDAFFGVPALA